VSASSRLASGFPFGKQPGGKRWITVSGSWGRLCSVGGGLDSVAPAKSFPNRDSSGQSPPKMLSVSCGSAAIIFNSLPAPVLNLSGCGAAAPATARTHTHVQSRRNDAHAHSSSALAVAAEIALVTVTVYSCAHSGWLASEHLSPHPSCEAQPVTGQARASLWPQWTLPTLPSCRPAAPFAVSWHGSAIHQA